MIHIRTISTDPYSNVVTLKIEVSPYIWLLIFSENKNLFTVLYIFKFQCMYII